jgi:hypothetical protein
MISFMPARLAANIFSFIPPTGRTFPRRVIFAGHSDVGAYRLAGEQGSQGAEHSDPGGGAIFGDSAFGDMDMHIALVNFLLFDA